MAAEEVGFMERSQSNGATSASISTDSANRIRASLPGNSAGRGSVMLSMNGRPARDHPESGPFRPLQTLRDDAKAKRRRSLSNRAFLASNRRCLLVGLRDRAVVSILIYAGHSRRISSNKASGQGSATSSSDKANHCRREPFSYLRQIPGRSLTSQSKIVWPC